MKKLETIKEYLSYIGSDKIYSQTAVSCEICGGDDFQMMVEYTDGGHNTLVPVQVQSCKSCGFLMQNPRFEPEFYQRYYDEFYPILRAKSNSNLPGDKVKLSEGVQVNPDGTPTEVGFNNARTRAKFLLEYLQNNLPKPPSNTLLDVGCGCGGFMSVFHENGYEVLGNDPDSKTALYGQSKGLNIDILAAENMEYDRKFGLIIIIGSLEHCHNPNIVLKKCWDMLDEDGIIVIEGRYSPVSESYRWLNANHHRFFTEKSSEAIFVRHGFDIIHNTHFPVCGSNTGRQGGGFCFGQKKMVNKRYDSEILEKKSSDFLAKLKEKDLIVNPSEWIELIHNHDKKLANNH